MIRINLLPWREQRRAQRLQQFIVGVVLAFVASAAIGYLGNAYYGSLVDTQNRRNAYIEAETKKLEKEIEEIKDLKAKIADLVQRKQVIEALQGSRSEAVHLLNALVTTIPDGLYLTSVKQTGEKVILQGYAQSSSRVSTLMRNLEDSPFLHNAGLVEVKAALVQNRRMNEFTMNINIVRGQQTAATNNDQF